jgi:hypothetical protein
MEWESGVVHEGPDDQDVSRRIRENLIELQRGIPPSQIGKDSNEQCDKVMWNGPVDALPFGVGAQAR